MEKVNLNLALCGLQVFKMIVKFDSDLILRNKMKFARFTKLREEHNAISKDLRKTYVSLNNCLYS